MKLPHIDKIRDALIDAGELDILPRFQQLEAEDVMEKKPGDLVTIADIEAEKRLTRRLMDMLPGSVVIGEEAHHHNPDIFKFFDQADYVWLVDPIDGTSNFVSGKPTFCVMAALVVRKQAAMACIYDPVTKNTAFAEQGSGAFFNHAPILSPAARPFQEMVGQVNLGLFARKTHTQLRRKLKDSFKTIDHMRCAGHDFVNQALGKRHFALYRSLWSWDHVPGVLILREAGGYVGRIDGHPYHAQERSHGLLSAPDRDTWEALSAYFKKMT